jgi:hypothetical protein
MNLLGIQDALKNASDDQLKNMISAPDSTAPSYLVLSELRRREEMRAQQAQAPQTTIAEDLTSERNMQAPMGIRSLSTPEPGDEDYPTEEGNGIEAMREGGIVRMYEGDKVEAKEGDERSRAGQALDYITRQFGNVVEATPRVIEGNLEAARRGLKNNPYTYLFGSPSEHTQAGNEQQYLIDNAARIRNGQFDMEAFRRNPAEYMRANPTAPRTATPPTAQPPAARTEGGAPAEELPIPPVPPGAPGAPAGGGAGIRTLSGAVAPAAVAPQGPPTIAANMERNLALFPGIPQELLDRIQASRTNEGERRSEARRMALVEAGLRIAASRNPSIAGAIGEGAAPVVQSYNQQIGQIRQDQNADITRELAVAQQDLQRRYMAGQISASELQRQVQMLEIAARERQSLRTEAGANARAGASLSRAERMAELQMRRDAQTAANTAARAQATQTATAVQAAIANPLMRAQATTALRAEANNPRLSPTEDQIEDWITNRVTTRMNNVYEQSRPLATSNTPRTNATVIPGQR